LYPPLTDHGQFDIIAVWPWLAGDEMQFDQLKRREFIMPAACAPLLVRAHFKSMAEYYRGLPVAADSPSHRSFGALPHSPPLAIRET
jgi:hypothetical protein